MGDRVLQFVAKHSKSRLDASAILAELESTVAQREKAEVRREWTAKWGKSVAIAVGLIGVLIFVAIRQRLRMRERNTAPASAAEAAAASDATSRTPDADRDSPASVTK